MKNEEEWILLQRYFGGIMVALLIIDMHDLKNHI
jgi:hypothetical protein